MLFWMTSIMFCPHIIRLTLYACNKSAVHFFCLKLPYVDIKNVFSEKFTNARELTYWKLPLSILKLFLSLELNLYGIQAKN